MNNGSPTEVSVPVLHMYETARLKEWQRICWKLDDCLVILSVIVQVLSKIIILFYLLPFLEFGGFLAFF